MKRAKKRYTIKFKNIRGQGSLGTYTKLEKAQHEIKMNELHDRNEIAQGYKDLQTTYWIEESVVY